MSGAQYRLNGRACALDGPPDRRLVDILREEHGLTAAKPGCGIGRCGGCLVLLDGRPANACLVMAYRLDGAEIVSPEGLDACPEAEAVRGALIDENAFQCGYCAPGFTIALVALFRLNPDPDEAAILEALAGNLCRCTGYASILRGAREAARRLKTARPSDPTRRTAESRPRDDPGP